MFQEMPHEMIYQNSLRHTFYSGSEQRKDTGMNLDIHTQKQLDMATYSETTLNEMDVLTQWGFSSQEITSLLWLRQWYQSGGSDRSQIVRHLEFLRLLVNSGDLEL